MDDPLDRIKQKRAEAARKADEDNRTNKIVEAVNDRPGTQDVNIQNEDLAKKEDIDAVIAQLKEVQLASLLGGQQKPSIIMADSTDLGEKIGELSGQFGKLITAATTDTQSKNFKLLADKLDTLSKGITGLKADKDILAALKTLNTSVGNIDTNPTVNVPTPIVNVDAPAPDLSSLTNLMSEVRDAVKGIEIPLPNNEEIIYGLVGIQSSIENLAFPVPNYILPFKDINGKAIQVQLDADGNVPTSSGGGSGTQYAEGVTTAPATGTVALGRYSSTAPTLTNGQLNAPQLDASGDQLVAGAQKEATFSVTSASMVVSTDVQNYRSVSVHITSQGTNSIVSFEGSNDNTGWVPVALAQPGNMLSSAETSTTNNNRIYVGPLSFRYFRLNITGISAGTTAGTVEFYTHSNTTVTTIAGQIALNGTQTATLALNGVRSTANSTTSNLAGAAAFTGTGEEVLNYSAIQVSVFSSHVSATDGLSLQQSSDNTNWDIIDTYTIPASTGKVFSIQPAARYFRLVYTNGATLTTSLRIQAVFHIIAPNPSSQRTSDAYTNETDMTQNWVFNSLYNGTTWDRMRGDITNGLDVDITRVIPGTGATSLGKAEDAVAGAGDTGIFILGVRRDAATASAANGDYNEIRTDQYGQLPMVPGAAASATLTNVNDAATTTAILASNTARKGAIIHNDSTSALYIKFGSTASLTSYTYKIPADGTWEMPIPIYTGAIDGIWSADASGAARITELA